MREIKFRLRIGKEIIGYERWYKGNGSTAYWQHLKIGETVWYSTFLYATEKDQYTGLHDKNGKEIYEGDIITFIWNNKKWTQKVIFSNCGFYPAQFDIGLGEFPLINIEVIGNIYENPELLEEVEDKKSET